MIEEFKKIHEEQINEINLQKNNVEEGNGYKKSLVSFSFYSIVQKYGQNGIKDIYVFEFYFTLYSRRKK